MTVPVDADPAGAHRGWRATDGPVAELPPRRVGSIRRTSTIDAAPSDDMTQLVLDGTARDLLTDANGVAQVIERATMRVGLALVGRTVVHLEATRDDEQVDVADLARCIGRLGFPSRARRTPR